MYNEKGRYINPYIMYLARLLRGNFRETLQKEGLFAGQHEIIGMLCFNPGITASMLAKKLDLTQATVSVSLKRLEKSGFVRKENDDSDSRTAKLFLTMEGQKLHEKIEEAMVSTEDKLLLGMTDEEIVLFRGFLQKAIENLTPEDSWSFSLEQCFDGKRKRGDKKW